jgi:Carboxypeptidase regulatory-like domain
MYEFRQAKEHVIARSSHKAFRLVGKCLLLGLMVAVSLEAQQSSPSAPAWTSVVCTAAGEPVAGAKVTIFTPGATKTLVAVTGTDGRFTIADLRLGQNRVSVQMPGRSPTEQVTVNITSVPIVLTVSDQNALSIGASPQTPTGGVADGTASTTSNPASGTGGEKLSSQKVNELPLNGRDFSTLLLLAAGTMTDVNGQTNFTQQFAINGQRGVEAVFAMDDADVSDPEMGGSTFTNFNVDAIQELQSSSGWMPADIGRGAAGFTNIVTRSGKSGFHGSFFEFLRNSALDARNYFDHPSIAEPGRIPPFRRNEFGFTNGGPVILPHVYNGRDRTFYFVQYQGFRQVLGTTQVLAVPTAAERAGQDMVKYPDGSTDTLQVPVNPAIAAVLARSTPQPPNWRVWCANLCCTFKCKYGCRSVFYPHRSESWSKRTIVWSIQLRQSNGTDNKSGSDAD